MILVGKLKEAVDKTTTAEEARDMIEQAGMLLTDDELEQVAGGANTLKYSGTLPKHSGRSQAQTYPKPQG